jgi:hypothetical protein
MEGTHDFRFKGRILHCAPTLLPDGSFSAQVTIESGHGGPAVTEETFPALRCFSKEADAVDYAHDHGRRVINEQG